MRPFTTRRHLLPEAENPSSKEHLHGRSSVPSNGMRLWCDTWLWRRRPAVHHASFSRRSGMCSLSTTAYHHATPSAEEVQHL